MNRNFSFYFLYLSESINVIMVDASIELVFEQVLLGVGGGGGWGRRRELFYNAGEGQIFQFSTLNRSFRFCFPNTGHVIIL